MVLRPLRICHRIDDIQIIRKRAERENNQLSVRDLFLGPLFLARIDDYDDFPRVAVHVMPVLDSALVNTLVFMAFDFLVFDPEGDFALGFADSGTGRLQLL